MRLLMTDITEMHQGNYCVAGWNAATGRMVRPLPNGSNWTTQMLATHGIRGGATIQFSPIVANLNGTFPHRTEDTAINPAAIAAVKAVRPGWLTAAAPPMALSLDAAFQGHIETTGEWNGALKGAFVAEGAQIGSLAAVRVERDNFEFFEGNFNGTKSLRAYLTDGDGCYSLPVVARNFRESYRAEGVDQLNDSLPAAGDLHVRVGLARAWAGQPGKCTAMINGLYW